MLIWFLCLVRCTLWSPILFCDLPRLVIVLVYPDLPFLSHLIEIAARQLVWLLVMIIWLYRKSWPVSASKSIFAAESRPVSDMGLVPIIIPCFLEQRHNNSDVFRLCSGSELTRILFGEMYAPSCFVFSCQVSIWIFHRSVMVLKHAELELLWINFAVVLEHCIIFGWRRYATITD